MAMDERVLVIPESHFQRVGYFEGFRPADEAFAEHLLDPAQFSFRARALVESDPSFKQLIPYVLLTHGDRIFHYRRGAKGTETRLQALRSVGIGGHISEADASGDGHPYDIGLQRELDEEVIIGAIVRRTMLGFIYDPRTPVGSVHLGIVHHFELQAAQCECRDPALTESGFDPIADLKKALNAFETWSQFSLEHLQ